jgi:imidazolonepropionase-like amidohydrolase
MQSFRCHQGFSAPGVLSALLALSTGGGCASQRANTTAQNADPYATAIQELSGPPASEDSPPILIRGATVMTAAGQIFAPGTLLMRHGRIAQVGQGEIVADPDMRVVEAAGQYVTPGIIDAHSHIGVFPWPDAKGNEDGNESIKPITADLWAEHSFWPQDPGLTRALAAGVTTINVLPGSANLVGGRSFVAKLVPRTGARMMRFPGAPYGIKMACGENPKRTYGMVREVQPKTRMAEAAALRAAFLEAREYRQRWKRFDKAVSEWRKDHPAEDPFTSSEGLEVPNYDLNLETLAKVLDGTILVQMHCYRADDMHVMLDIAEELGFKIRAFHHALEGYKLRDRLVKEGVAAATWADWWGFKMEAYDGVPQNAALLSQAGVRTVIHSDSAEEVRHLNQEAAKAMTAGKKMGIVVGENEVLRWITANPAWVLGVDHEVGTLEIGKMADVVVWDHHPFSVYARPSHVFVDGYEVFAREKGAVPGDFELGAVPGERTP